MRIAEPRRVVTLELEAAPLGRIVRATGRAGQRVFLNKQKSSRLPVPCDRAGVGS